MNVQIKKIPCEKDPSDCVLPCELFESLGLLLGVMYAINFGGICKKAFVATCKSEGTFMFFSNRLLDKLMLPTDITLNIWRKGEEICLGPVVGVFVNTRFLRRFENNCPYEIAIENMKASWAANSLCYYFSIDNIDWEGRRIKGYSMLPGSGKWRCTWFPVPNVIYDRGVNFNDNQMEAVNRLRSLFKAENNIHLINNKSFLEKWEIHKMLMKYPEMEKYLPETILYEGFKSVEAMLNKYDFIFIKSSLGSKGKEVFAIEKIGDKYRMVFNNHGLKEIEVDSIERVRKYVTRFVGGKQFIIQHGVRLIKYLDRKMDIRVLVIKNEEGQWEATNYYCRCAKGNLTVTNRSTGGDIENYENAYPDLIAAYGKGIIPTEEELKRISIEIASFIEKDAGTMGEIGMDIAIDESGRIWFLEANGKPDKALIEGVDDMDAVSPKALAIFKYANYLVEKEYTDENKASQIYSNKNRSPRYYIPGITITPMV